MENLELVELKQEELQSLSGGCGWYGWCPERIVGTASAAVSSAVKYFEAGMEAGKEAFDIHK